jgi:hypothetical protein
MRRANTAPDAAQAADLACSFGLTGLNSQDVFRTSIAHCAKASNPAGARLAGSGE